MNQTAAIEAQADGSLLAIPLSMIAPIIVFWMSSLSLVFAHASETSEVTELAPWVLGQGEQRLLRIPDLLRYSVGSPAVRSIRLPKAGARDGIDHLLIKGVQPGAADLWIWSREGGTVVTRHRAIRVAPLPSGELKAGLEKALSPLEETEVFLSGSGATLRGKVTQMRELARIAALTEAFPAEIRDQTEVAEPLLREGEARLREWLMHSPFSTRLFLQRQDQALILSGNLERSGDPALIRKKAKALFPSVILELDALPDNSPTVHFKVFLLELRRDRFHSMGLAWPGAQEGAFRVTSSRIEDMLQLDLALQALEGDGSARILSNPELVVRAPGEAELFSGGELPVQTFNRFNSQVNWKDFGLMLRLKVTHSTTERVRLDISTEVSHLDPAISVGTLPGIQANRMKTQVDARYGTPLLLSGLLQQGTRQKARGLPLLRQIPVLGLLFGSEDYLNERSELVAILLPNLTPPAAPMHRLRSRTPAGPKGVAPPPRNWISPEEERRLRAQPAFPWNTLGDS